MLLLEKLDSSELKLLNLDKKAAELQKDKDSLVYRLAGERSFANEAIEKLESEAKSLVSKNAEAKLMISQLTYFAKNQQEAIENLSEKVRISEDIKAREFFMCPMHLYLMHVCELIFRLVYLVGRTVIKTFLVRDGS